VDINCPRFTNDQTAYLKWLKEKLQFLHKGTSQNLAETKSTDAAGYNRRHHTAVPSIKVGDEVYLLDRRIKPRSDQVLTHKPYTKRFVVVDKVEAPNIGTAFRLADIRTGQPLKSLIAPHRLKLCLSDVRADLIQRLSSNVGTGTNAARPSPPVNTTLNQRPLSGVTPTRGPKNANARSRLEPAIKILKQKKGLNGEMQFLVLFANKSKYWCDRVTPLLLREYRLHQAELRTKRKTHKLNQ
jgi:hypothetical protein